MVVLRHSVWNTQSQSNKTGQGWKEIGEWQGTHGDRAWVSTGREPTCHTREVGIRTIQPPATQAAMLLPVRLPGLAKEGRRRVTVAPVSLKPRRVGHSPRQSVGGADGCRRWLPAGGWPHVDPQKLPGANRPPGNHPRVLDGGRRVGMQGQETEPGFGGRWSSGRAGGSQVRAGRPSRRQVGTRLGSELRGIGALGVHVLVGEHSCLVHHEGAPISDPVPDCLWAVVIELFEYHKLLGLIHGCLTTNFPQRGSAGGPIQ